MNRRLFAAALLGALTVAGPAMADPILTASGQTEVRSGGQAPGSASDYTFFGGVQPTNLTDFTVTLAPGDSQYPGTYDNGHGPYTTVIAPGGTTAFLTGIAYARSGAGTTAELATFQTTFTGDFDVWILDGNTDTNGVGNSSVGLNVDGGTVTNVGTILAGANEFTEFSVTGASTSDVFGVYATGASTGDPSIGGLTFTSPSAAVPEPSSLAMCGIAGVVGLVVARARRKRLAA